MQLVHITLLKCQQMQGLLKCSLVAVAMFFMVATQAQITAPYISKVKESADSKMVSHERVVTFGLTSNKNWFIFYNPVHLTLAGMMYFYQKEISRQLPSSCLYSPSCSSYSKSLISRYGIVKGIICSSDRLMRCNRLTATAFSSDKFDKHDHKVHESIEIYHLK